MNEKRPTESELSGMTLNERLFACGLLAQWDEAVRLRDRERMVFLLCEVGLDTKGAEFTVNKVLGG